MTAAIRWAWENCGELIDLGYADGLAAQAEIIQFLQDQPAPL